MNMTFKKFYCTVCLSVFNFFFVLQILMSRSVYLYFFFTDTYVKVCVLVQNKVVKTKKTEVHKKTDTPNYNESFTFKLPVTSLDSASLSLTIMQHSSGHKGEWMTGDDSG